MFTVSSFLAHGRGKQLSVFKFKLNLIQLQQCRKNAQNNFVIHFVKFAVFMYNVSKRMNFLALVGQMPRVLILEQTKSKAHYNVVIRGLLFKRQTCGSLI